MKNLLFISGTGRSGTTLLDKLLSCHPDMTVLSQPFPYLFIHAKKKFLSSLGYENEYNVLSNCFFEKRYTISDLNDFLSKLLIKSGEIIELFEQMQDYSGQLTKLDDINTLKSRITDDLFINQFKNLLYIMQKNKQSKYIGSKEIVCEEFFPFFVNNSVKCILIIRDPRDVITSLNFGDSEKYIGKHRPTLFNIQNWRKSVAFKIHLENNKNFAFIKYEDLVNDPLVTLNKVAEFLEIEKFNDDMLHTDWVGNSSFNQNYSGISQDSHGKYKELMPQEMINYIEATCFPEMKHLGYDVNIDTSNYEQYILSYKEPFSITRPEFEPNFSTSKPNLDREIQRIKQVSLKQDIRNFYEEKL
ncbi:MAG: hypothetical protein A2Y25_04335 [Candidatus Melainabacteria bacterium GWF2_37_15]|nr:MAG: hypothetical protein A2Y25_04335 [Candidatus Melainabacteria bacterium GWF2_37_15]